MIPPPINYPDVPLSFWNAAGLIIFALLNVGIIAGVAWLMGAVRI